MLHLPHNLPPQITPELYRELMALSPEERAYIRRQGEEARRKLIQQQAEEGLLSYTKWIFKERTKQDFIVNFHHEEMAEYLEAVVRGEIANLLMNLPPRYGKTEEGVVCFSSWCFARNAASNFIHLSYAEKLVLDNSSKIRETIGHEAFQGFWPMKFSEDTNAKGLWRNDQGGGFLAVAAGGTITGFGAGSTVLGCYGRKFAGAILIDDPLKPDDRRSEVERDNVNDRLNNTIISRRNSRETPIILIMQRLHEEDMTGYILENNTPLQWTHLKQAALRKDGHGRLYALWPHKHTVEELLALKKADPEMFSGQMQQEPAPEDGNYFKREMFRRYTRLPDNVNFYGASDYATKDGEGDYTVHGIVAVDPEDNIYVVDWWREQTQSDVWVERAIDMMEAWEPLAWGEEVGQIRNVMDPILRKRMQERRVYCHRVPYPTTSETKDKTAKMAKCRSIQARMSNGKVFFPEHAVWVSDLEDECVKFPNGKHDDQCDVLGTLGRMIMGMHGDTPPPAPKKPEIRGIDEASIDELYAQQERDH